MIKRIFDIILSSLGLLFSFPLWIIITLLIYLEAGRPIFFIQERVGQGGNPLKLIKFRSMVKGAEIKTQGLHGEEIPREMITKIGRILRNTALDELPQLISILKGDMSFVGPRAVLPIDIISLDSNEQNLRLSIRPGLTGIAQIYGRDDISPKQRLRFEKLYIKRRNFWVDLKLIFLSFWITLRARWKIRRKKL